MVLFKNAFSLVTRGASGFGCATVERFARVGSKVMLIITVLRKAVFALFGR